MTTIVTRAGKGSALTWTEADANFTNLNTDKLEASDLTPSTAAAGIGFIQAGTGAVATTVQAKLREFVDGADFGMVGDNSTDNTAAFDLAVTAALASSHRHLYLRSGVYKFNSQPAAITGDLHIIGDGMLSTVLVRNFNGTNAVGLLRFVDTSSGFSVQGLAIQAASGTSVGSAISVVGSASAGVSGFLLEDLYLTCLGTDNWDNCVYMDGSAKTTAAAGNRTNNMRNVHIFGASNTSIYLKSMISLTWEGGGLYSAGGTGTYTGGIWLTGTAGVNSQYINVNISVINGSCNFTYCQDVYIKATQIGAIVNDNTAARCVIDAYTGSSVQDNWTASMCLGKYTKANNGYLFLPAGMILQWGSTVCTTSQAITFPKQFPAAISSVTLGPNGDCRTWITSLATTGFTANESSGVAKTIYWQAIGY